MEFFRPRQPIYREETRPKPSHAIRRLAVGRQIRFGRDSYGPQTILACLASGPVAAWPPPAAAAINSPG